MDNESGSGLVLGSGPESTDIAIQLLENRISDGVNVDDCKRALREVLRNRAATASLNQEIPAAPPTLEQARLQQLYDPDTTKLYDDEDMKNYHAVVRDYETNAITHPPPGKVYFYYKGFRVTDQVATATARPDEAIRRLVEEHGIGKVWAEGGVESMPMQMSAASTVFANDMFHQRMVVARVQTLDGALADFSFLEETGSDIMSIFEIPDLAMLAVNNGSQWWAPDVTISTAGGLIIRRALWVRTRWFCSRVQTLGTDWILQRVAVNPGVWSAPGNCPRLSGMSLRHVFYTETTPDGIGNLRIGDKK